MEWITDRLLFRTFVSALGLLILFLFGGLFAAGVASGNANSLYLLAPPRGAMTPDEALDLAAWLVVMVAMGSRDAQDDVRVRLDQMVTALEEL